MDIEISILILGALIMTGLIVAGGAISSAIAEQTKAMNSKE